MTFEKMGLNEEVWISKKSRRKHGVGIRGRVWIEKYRDGEDEPFEVVGGENTINTEGIQFFISTLVNDNGNLPSQSYDTSHFDTNAYVWLRSTSGGAVTNNFQVNGTTPVDETATNSPGHRIRWTAEDNSVDTYSFQYLSLANNTPGAGPPDPLEFNEYNFGSSQSKPSDQNWHYNVEIELYSTDTDFVSAGLEFLMDLFTGASSAHLTTSTVLLQPKTSAQANVGTAFAPDSVTQDYNAQDITLVFTSANGSNEGAWDETEVQVNSGSTNLRDGECKQDDTGCGTKGTGEEWEYTYTFTFSA